MGEWKSYRSSAPTSGVIRYRIDDNLEYIDIEFAHTANQIYRYKRSVIGDVLDDLISRAQKGEGLSTYINDHPEVRYGFTVIDLEHMTEQQQL